MVKATTYADGTTPSVCIVGAGFSGLTAGIKLKSELGLTSFTIFDENHEVGGTWLVNSYPGCACDIKSHFYCWSFEPNPYWSQNYSSRDEILEYIQGVTRKYKLYPHIKFNSVVRNLAWDDEVRKWRVKVHFKETRVEQELLFDLVLNGPGYLRIPHVPKEFGAFKGPTLHSGAWDPSVEWEGKVVGVVGSGSSAIQMITAMGPKVKELHCYQRRPAWVMPSKQCKLPGLLTFLLAHVPFLLLLVRWLVFLGYELGIYRIFLHKSWMHTWVTYLGGLFLEYAVEDEVLREKLTPKFEVGCKRINVSSEYFPVMCLPHVKLHREPILDVLEDGILTSDGIIQSIDVLVLGTGFTVQDFFAPMTILGRDSVDILAAWKKDRPKSYLGMMDSNLPNMFFLSGPGAGVVHSSLIFMLECQMDYIVQVLKELMKREGKVVQVRPAAVLEYNREVEEQTKKMIWSQGQCGAWFCNERNMNTVLWPWNGIKYWQRTRKLDSTKLHFS